VVKVWFDLRKLRETVKVKKSKLTDTLKNYISIVFHLYMLIVEMKREEKREF